MTQIVVLIVLIAIVAKLLSSHVRKETLRYHFLHGTRHVDFIKLMALAESKNMSVYDLQKKSCVKVLDLFAGKRTAGLTKEQHTALAKALTIKLAVFSEKVAPR